MRKLILSSCLIITALFLSIQLSAQKYGHLNSGNLLQELPMMKSADAELKNYQDQLVKKGETMAAAFQQKLGEYTKNAQAGTLSQIQMQQIESELQKERDGIMKYEQEVITKVQEKRQTLLEPILKKVDEAIQAVGKEKGYVMIFDTSLINTILFVQDVDDIMPLVKAQLGP